MSQLRPRLTFLSEEMLDRIEETAYRLLDEVGISLQHDGAKEMLHGRGCSIQGDRTFIPPHVVHVALKNTSPHTQVYNRDGSLAFALGEGPVRVHNGGGPPFVYDLETGIRRSAELQDVAEAARVLDALTNVDMVVPLFGPQDVRSELLVVASTEVALRNTSKPVTSAAVEKPECVPYLVRMAAACCGGMAAYREHPTMVISVSPVSPLTFPEDITSAIMAIVESGSPFYALPAPCLGATSPITMAAAVAQQHAEVLASLVIAAVALPGALVGYSSRISPIDVRTAISTWGGPEVGVTAACAGQLAHRLGLPCDGYGLSSHATTVGAQFAYERLTNALVPALAGVDILSGVGTTESGMAGALEIAVIDDELIRLVRRVARGCPVNEETLAFDVMRDVIRADGVFLAEEHTVRHMRGGALWMPDLGVWPTSSPSDHEDAIARAKHRAATILREHEVQPLPDGVSRELDAIMDQAHRELTGAQ